MAVGTVATLYWQVRYCTVIPPTLLHGFQSFSPPHQISEPDVSSVPLNIVYEDDTCGKGPKKPHKSHLVVRRSTHWVCCQKQRAHWHQHVLPKLIRPYMAWVHHHATGNSDQPDASSAFPQASAIDPGCTCLDCQ